MAVLRAGTFDPQPLLQLAELRSRERFAPRSTAHQPDSLVSLAGVLGVPSRQVARWRAGRGVALRVADRSACRLGVHPTSIWPTFDQSREVSP